VAQTLTFLLAGYETSASAIGFVLYELALHPEIQQLSEHDGKLTYGDMQGISYLDRVVSGEERKLFKIII
jgi:cytochrome P450